MATTKKTVNGKQIIGYVTQYSAWKNIPGLVSKGAYCQLNLDFSKYTILNFSFFGLARDGTLHSGDDRNKDIYKPGEVQNPADLLHQDYNDEIPEDPDPNAPPPKGMSFDKPILFGQTDGPPGGAHGLLKMAKDADVMVMASLGGWSMSKHFCEVAADTTMRETLVRQCRMLVDDYGFDGIDFDWEYPNAMGMNIENYSEADYGNFAKLMGEVRDAIGPERLITAAMSATPANLGGFDWAELERYMDYFNLMTYDVNGGWSDIAGHNSPLYYYPGSESPVSLDGTTRFLLSQGVKPEKINLGVAFYGRGVITESSAALNAPTVKKMVEVDPDGPILSSGDFDNWPQYSEEIPDGWDATPFTSAILQKTGGGGSGGWKYHWDEDAQVPYLTKGKYFLSYDDERSVRAKAEYIKENNLGGVIIWTTFGDLMDLTKEEVVVVDKYPLIKSGGRRSILVDEIYNEFSNGLA
ncbi:MULTISPECIES: glycosyl hydrolase family 18 protein [unclassified Burkholderia]|uniref:glycoside hydrolase family 18 protein n=1 Tax=unclassified Burkholderia TaxID=2613784 RepID=UPI0009E6ABF0|nr:MULTISPECIES: glycosyl hydrolase family 18 protein [unclassified Burkholderia]